MSPLRSGNKISPQTLAINITDVSCVGEARRAAQLHAQALDFDEVAFGRVGIVVNELATNLAKYAQQGRILLRSVSEGSAPAVEILAVDHGPGFNISSVMIDGFTTGSSPGTGLGAVRRLSQVFDVHSGPSGSVVLSSISAGAVPVRDDFVVGAVNLALHGELESGDSWAVRTSGGQLAVLVVDGLGHGPLAARAAAEAVEVFGTEQLPLDRLMQVIHHRLKSTRGGAVFLAATDGKGDVRFTGVGNIRALLLSESACKTLISQNGTAGLQIRAARVLTERWPPSALLILHSDGITSRWTLDDDPSVLRCHPSIIAAVIARTAERGNDDATVVVVRRADGV